jgi:alcohol dehydrogenase
MLAARLHAFGEPMVLERIPKPAPRHTDVLVKVAACGVVPNLRNVLSRWRDWFPELPLPKLPAIFGLDVAGVVAEAGAGVQNFKVGSRVYVSPGLSRSCPSCRRGDSINCPNFTFRILIRPDAQRRSTITRSAACASSLQRRNAPGLAPDTVSF